MAEPLRAKLRRALFDVFSDGELNDFAFDYFPQVYNNFTGGMDKRRKTDTVVLLAACKTDVKMDAARVTFAWM